ncbi:MAG: RidA family protein [Sedimentisphaerales bacterium]
MSKKIINTEKAPAAVGPYSQAVSTAALVFASGQIPMDPATGSVVTGDIKTQTRQVLNNLKEVLEAAGSSLDKVVKATVFITNMDDFPVVNKIYAEFFPADPPARACVEVSRLPKGVNVEIEAVALVGED